MLDHPGDLEADFLRFYGLDPEHLSGPRFLSLAYRVGAYGGVMTARQEEARVAAVPHHLRSLPPDTKIVESTPAAILADPDLSEVISFG